jgi:large subunit ribosomal protein L29
MKTSEMRELTVDELVKEIEKARQELFDARFKKALYQLDNTAKLKLTKLRIARLQTVLQEKQAPAKQGAK